MKNREINKKIHLAFSHITPPDVLDSVLSDCRAQNDREEKGKVFIMAEKKHSSQWIKWAVGAAAAFVLLVGGGVGIRSYQINHTIDSTVSLDVNPSVEISVNQKEEVLSVTAKNDDARTVIGDMDFRGSSLDVTVNALIGSMLRNGYLSELANSILVSVDCDDPVRSAELQQKLTDEINQLLQNNLSGGSVLSQTISANTELQQLADDYGITLGKAQLIQEIVNQDPRYAFKDLAALSINDLNLLHNADVSTPDTIETVGSASDKAYIGEESAKAAALAHAGLSESDISRFEIEFDFEDGIMVYEISFYAGTYEYGYDINATTGAVVSYERDRDDDTPQQNGSTATGEQSSNYITEAEAKAVALAHAGLSESDVTFVRAHLDYDDGRAEYEIEFWSGNTEYDYDIDAVSGEIRSYDHDAEYYSPAQNSSSNNTSSGSSNSSYITEAEAKAVALAHAGLSESDVTFVRAHLDYDDGRAEYEIEFWSGNTEYDYDIDAVSGEIRSYDHDAEYYSPAQNSSSGNASSGSYISADDAKSIAFTHAGVNASNAYNIECELDRDDGRVKYEIEFKSDGYEYSYEIDAETGSVIQSEREFDD